MKIALTKKLADAIGVSVQPLSDDTDPLFTWTANWTNVWSNRKKEDMLVLVNSATLFRVAIYQVKKKDLKNISEIMKTAIYETLLAFNLNPEVVREYMQRAGEIEFNRNNSRKMAAWVTKAGLDSAFFVGREYNDTGSIFSVTAGAPANHTLVKAPGNPEDYHHPYEAMIKELTELTGKQAYKYRAFELKVTLDLDIYKAVRRIIVPADIKLKNLHKILQSIYNWRNCHLYDFRIPSRNDDDNMIRIVPFEEDLEYDPNATLMKERILSDIFPEHNSMTYTYDFGDNWEHEIQLEGVIDEHNEESPYLLEASGQAPPEDVGGVGGFVYFHGIMKNQNHPEHHEMKEWAHGWKLELREWESSPRVISYAYVF